MWRQQASKEPDQLVVWVSEDARTVRIARLISSFCTLGLSCHLVGQKQKVRALDRLNRGTFGSNYVSVYGNSKTAPVTTHVYDLDTTLPFPCSLTDYIIESFQPHRILTAEYQRCFRLIPAGLFLQHFASDRSHMVRKMEGLLN